MGLFPDTPVSSLAEFVTTLATIRTKPILWFRGQPRANYGLVPSLARLGGDWLAAERTMRSRFEQNASALVPVMQRSDWDWMLLMQHYGVPTRLLDWSENPLVALYFATVGSTYDRRYDGALWVLDPVALNAVSSIPPTNDIPVLDMDDALDPYSTKAIAGSLISHGPIAVLAKRQFPRLVAQSGVFTVIHRDRTPLNEVRAGDFVGRIVIPRGVKAQFVEELRAVGATRLALFPELESVAATTKSFLP
jgi:hypothetical protein